MTSRLPGAGLVLLLLLVPVTAAAQRGGGRGGGGANDATVRPPALDTVFDNAEYGMKIPAPPDMSLFTPEHPGSFRQVFTERKILYIVNLMGKDATVQVKYSPGVTDGDLKALKSVLESKPPQAQLPEYKKLSVTTIKIGSAGDKEAVEHVYTSKDKDVTVRTRQVVFVHNGKGFTFTCAAPDKEFGGIDKKSFQPLFASIEFR